MKKGLFFVLVFSAISMMSCGGSNSDNPASAEEAYLMTNQFYSSYELPGVNSLTPDTYQEQVDYSWDALPCQTSGTYKFDGINYYNESDPAASDSWKYAYTVTFNNCAGPDSMCNTGEIFTLNGTPTISFEYRSDTNKYIMTFGGDYSYAGPISGTCVMDFELVFDVDQYTGISDYSSSSGTMCGYDMSDIEAMADSGVDYCDTLSSAI